jgi:hypothetical protein
MSYKIMRMNMFVVQDKAKLVNIYHIIRCHIWVKSNLYWKLWWPQILDSPTKVPSFSLLSFSFQSAGGCRTLLLEVRPRITIIRHLSPAQNILRVHSNVFYLFQKPSIYLLCQLIFNYAFLGLNWISVSHRKKYRVVGWFIRNHISQTILSGSPITWILNTSNWHKK